jgi:hypothetical protein
MSDSKDVINRAYGGIPKEAGVLVFNFDFMPGRSIKYYWYRLLRKITR